MHLVIPAMLTYTINPYKCAIYACKGVIGSFHCLWHPFEGLGCMKAHRRSARGPRKRLGSI